MADREVVRVHLIDAFECLQTRRNQKGEFSDLEQFNRNQHDRRRLLGRVLYCRQNGFSDEEIIAIIGNDLLVACDNSDDEPT
ncbi:MAG: hypothetical protein WCK48_00860 [bacterium]